MYIFLASGHNDTTNQTHTPSHQKYKHEPLSISFREAILGIMCVHTSRDARAWFGRKVAPDSILSGTSGRYPYHPPLILIPETQPETPYCCGIHHQNDTIQKIMQEMQCKESAQE